MSGKLIGSGVLGIALLSASFSESAQATRSDAVLAARGWLKEGKQRLGGPMADKVAKTIPFDGFYVVQLEPGGFIVMADDDEIEPVLAYSRGGVFELDADNPLRQVLAADTTERKSKLSRARREARADDPTLREARRTNDRWGKLKARGQDEAAPKKTLDAATDSALPDGTDASADEAAVPSRSANVLSVGMVNGHIRLVHDAEESVSVYVSYDSGASWALLDSGVVWPEWISKTPAGETMGWYKVEPDGLVDAMGVAAMRSPSPPSGDAGGTDDASAATEPLDEGLSGVADVRVSPLLQSKWSQTTAQSMTCYNYYTPNNWPCGCVATAMGQFLRFWQYPASCYGHTYTYANMPLNPQTQPSLSLTHRQAIGQLLLDCGTAVDMYYGAGGSGAVTGDGVASMKTVFGYSNSRYLFVLDGIDTTSRNQVLQSNLAGGYPVIMSITGPSGGHAVVADGFGYSSGTPYYHVNMGWGGASDLWYNLPTVGSGFTIVKGLGYNIFRTGSGELIAGRVVNGAGAPITPSTITASRSGLNYTTTTDSKGCYAVKVPSGNTYSVTAAMAGYAASTLSVAVGTSVDNGVVCGNYANADFTLTAFSFTAMPLTGSAYLRWTQPTVAGMSNDTVYIRHRTDRYPTNATDGSLIYTGTSSSYEHFGLNGSGSVTNFYTIWGNNGSAYASISTNCHASCVAGPGLMAFLFCSDGRQSVWCLGTNGARRSSQPVFANALPAGWRIRGSGDVDADGIQDLILQNSSDGRTSVWFLNPDGTRRSSTNIFSAIPTNWVTRGVGDVDGDGTADLILQNTADGRTITWFLNANGTRRSSTTLFSAIPNTWVLRGVGDIDGDRTPDLILQNAADGKTSTWFLNADGTRRAGTNLYAAIPTEWIVRGIGDIDRDGTPDLVLQSTADGRTSAWFLNADGTRKSSASIYGPLPAGWVVRGVGDMDNDGTVDLVLQNTADGRTSAWRLNADGSRRASAPIYATALPTTWTLVTVTPLP